jgi:predicted RNase H-like HicB family nuclease
MLTKYLRAAMRLAKYEIQEDCNYFGSIPGLDGAWTSARSLEACREELAEILEDWLLFRLSRQLPIPGIGGMELTIRGIGRETAGGLR